MKPESLKQVRLILDIRREEAEKRIADAVKALHADHAAKGCLRSGATIKKHGAIITVEGQNFIKDTLDEIADVSQEIEAYLMFCEDFDIFTGNVGRNFLYNPVIKSMSQKMAIEERLKLLWNKIGEQLERYKELRRFYFAASESEQPSDFALKTIDQVTTNSSAETPPTPSKNKGGRPPAKFWDELWAAIAGQLYKGEIVPKSQADIEAAMLQWLENEGHSAAVSTVRKRARLLWQSVDSE